MDRPTPSALRAFSTRFAARLLLCSALVASPVAAQTDRDRLSERAFEGAQWVLATQAARAVAQVGARAAVGNGPLAEKIRTRQGIEDALDRQRRMLAKAIAASGDTAAISASTVRLTNRLDQLDSEIRAEFPRYAEFASPRPLGYGALQDLLDQDEALVLFLSDRTATYVWAISKTGTAWHRAPLSSRQLGQLVRRVRRDLDPTGPSRAAVPLSAPSGPRIAPFDADAAYQLYTDLLAPVMDTLAGASHVYVVKDGALASLPLSVLLTSPAPNEMDAKDLRAADWLLNAFALTTLPAVSSLSSIRNTPPRAPRPPRFAGFGNPRFAAVSAPPLQAASRAINSFFDAGGTNLDAIRALAPLPGTARELRKIAGLFPANAVTLSLGAKATEAAVKSTDLSGTSIISFATHGLITGDISGLAEPALAFTPPDTASDIDDGLLTASEASTLDLDADWVILSACNTAAGDGTPGAEGLSGLARAFLFAGARSILVSHWPVRDDVAATLTADTLRRLNENSALRRSQALQQAIQDVTQNGADPTLAHPSAWAPFVLVGDGGALY